MSEMIDKLCRLILTRENGERTKIGENIWLTIIKANGGKVRLMIEAPKEVIIVREECLEPEEQYNKQVGLQSNKLQN